MTLPGQIMLLEGQNLPRNFGLGISISVEAPQGVSLRSGSYGNLFTENFISLPGKITHVNFNRRNIYEMNQIIHNTFSVTCVHG